ncbi:MAG: hypothetical protein DME44_09720 [Verrucomicrobia bacterium]|nr:MAG: hypothetical protein DME44_09720 [Verrucomicrobiota bacterium]
MKITPPKSLLILGLLAASLLPVAATAQDADQILRQMSAKLAAAQSFTFKATRTVDPALLPGKKEPENARVAVTVQRPDKIAAHETSKQDERKFYADGQNLTLFDVQKNLYSIVPMQTSIDGLVEKIEQKYGFTPPLAEIAMSDVYKDIHQKAQSVSYLGQTSEGGEACHRLALSGKVVNAELWIGVSDQLPKRLVATVNGRPGKPQVKLEFSDWNLAANLTDKDFAFVPPAEALKISMITIEEAAAAQKKHKDTN